MFFDKILPLIPSALICPLFVITFPQSSCALISEKGMERCKNQN